MKNKTVTLGEHLNYSHCFTVQGFKVKDKQVITPTLILPRRGGGDFLKPGMKGGGSGVRVGVRGNAG